MPAQLASACWPATLGRYQISALLGEGAMGKVYKAFDPVIERTMAIKTISLRFEANELQQFKERFYREAKAAGGLNHPNIVTIYDVAEEDDVAYIAMELLEGLSLRQIIDSGSRPVVARTARIVAEVADALAYAHDRGVIHRDIKPANIVLTRAGLTKITDFGIAQLPATSMTQPGLLIGSPRYMSPEQIISKPVDGRADVFSLGAVLYEMLTGIAPFQGRDLGELMYGILHNTPLPPSEIAPQIPVSLDLIVERAMAKNPQDRYQNARDFARALRSFGVATIAPRAAPQAVNTAENESARPAVFPVEASARSRAPRKGLAFVVMGLAAGGVFASVAFNQFTPVSVEPLPSRLFSVAANTLAMLPSPFAGVTAPEAAPAPEPHINLQTPIILLEAPKPQTPSTSRSRPAKSKPTAVTELRNEVVEKLDSVRRELVDLRTRFTDLHPDVITKKRAIERLEEERRQRQRENS